MRPLALLTAAVLLLAHLPGALAQAPAGEAAELLFWETIRASTNPADFEEYLKQYPNGRFAGLARIRLRAAPAAASPGTAAPAKALEPKLASVPLPAAGASWKYRYTDRKYGRAKQVFSVRIARLSGLTVEEIVTPEGRPESAPRSVGINDLRFNTFELPASHTLLEFTPYFASFQQKTAPVLKMRSGSGYPVARSSSGDWQVVMTTLGEAQVAVPAGTFQAQRIQLKGARHGTTPYDPARFEVRAWYVPEVRRYVRLDHQVWNGLSTLLGDEMVELLEYSASEARPAQ